MIGGKDKGRGACVVTLMDGPVGRVLDFRVLDKKNRLGWLRSDGKRKERKTNIYGHLLRARHCARMAPLIDPRADPGLFQLYSVLRQPFT